MAPVELFLKQPWDDLSPENECRKCAGWGDIVTWDGKVKRCPECEGTGRQDAP